MKGGASETKQMQSTSNSEVDAGQGNSGCMITLVERGGCTHPFAGKKWVLCSGLDRRGGVRGRNVLRMSKTLLPVLCVGVGLWSTCQNHVPGVLGFVGGRAAEGVLLTPTFCLRSGWVHPLFSFALPERLLLEICSDLSLLRAPSSGGMWPTSARGIRSW